MKVEVADGEDLVEEEDVGVEVGGDGEGEAHIHAAGVILDGGVNEVFEAGELNNLLKLSVDFFGAHANDGAVEIDILAAAQLGVEADPHFEQRAHFAKDLHLAFCGASQARNDLEQSAFSGAVFANDSKDVPVVEAEVDVFEGPKGGTLMSGRMAFREEGPRRPTHHRLDHLAQAPACPRLTQHIVLSNVFDGDGQHRGYSSSAKVSSQRRK